MKLVCNNCSTKYSIADEKVAGRVFRTPCKRCGVTMIIEGPGAGANERSLLAERNENSLLFSLNNLASMGDEPAGRAPVHKARAEGSGLLDIRRMASAYHSERPATEPDFDEFTAITATAPMVLPALPERRNNKSPFLWLVGGATGMAALATIAVALLIFNTSSESDAQASPVVAVGETPAAVSPTPDPVSQPEKPVVATPETKAPETKEPKTKEPDTKEPETKEPAAKKPAENKPAEKKPERPRRPVEPEKPRVAEKPEKKPSTGCLEEVGCLLASNPPPCCRKYTEPKPSADPVAKVDPSLPKKLERSAILDSMRKINGRIAACSGRSAKRGQVTVSIKVGGSGKVSSVTVKESPDDVLGTCVAEAAKKASFPETQEGGKFSYPYVFR